jgi:hypothetical protein
VRISHLLSLSLISLAKPINASLRNVFPFGSSESAEQSSSSIVLMQIWAILIAVSCTAVLRASLRMKHAAKVAAMLSSCQVGSRTWTYAMAWR